MIGAFPKAKALLGDQGYDADWCRAALASNAGQGGADNRRTIIGELPQVPGPD